MESPKLKTSKKGEEKQPKFIEEPIQTVDGAVRIKKYAKLKVVGSGSYSKCYLVKNTDSDSTYVAKVIPKKKLQILQKQKLVYQIKIHQSLLHENIVHLDHWFQDENYQYIFMEYCSNGNLQAKLALTKTFEQKDIRRYAQQIVNAISYIHSQNILHRDLKLCNFYLDGNDNVKLGDFGFACQLANNYDRKRQTCGTPNYIAPQAISGFGYSYSSDVWAIGVILFRLKFGYCPFEGEAVKKTLQNVKLCNYKFPSKSKISPQLKDLIEKIFNLNYDERLTTQQILDHKFFQTDEATQPKKELKEEKRGFSLSKLFSRDKDKKQQSSSKARKGALERQSRNPTVVSASQKKQQAPKRSNSCQTFKQIKQIFKNKSKNSLATVTQPNQPNPSPYYTLNTMNSTTNQQSNQNSLLINKTLTNRASMLQYNNTIENMNLNLNLTMNVGTNRKQQSRSNRLNEFIKTQVNSISLKDQLKANKQGIAKNYMIINCSDKAEKEKDKKQVENQCNAKNQISKGQTNNNMLIINNSQKHPPPSFNNSVSHKNSILITQQQLYNYSRRFYLPISIQQQKDIIIIHYKPSLKHIIYSQNGYIIHKSTENIYKMNGELVNECQLPKVFKYVIENKLQIKDMQVENQQEYNEFSTENDIKFILQKISQSWNILKDGIILKYGSINDLMVAKLFAQEGYYVSDESGQPFMYNTESGKAKLLEGIVIMRIYNGWVKTYGKKS